MQQVLLLQEQSAPVRAKRAEYRSQLKGSAFDRRASDRSNIQTS